MHATPFHPAIIAAGAALILLSCGGEDKLKDALETVSQNDLAIMVLPQEELGDEYAGFDVVSIASGPLDNEGAANLLLDLDTSEADLEELGRTGGYALEYATGASNAEGGSFERYVGVRTVMHLFDDANGADGFIESEVEGAKESEGAEKDGFRLQQVETFEVDGVGGRAAGLQVEARLEDIGELDATAVLFHVGRLAGEALITRGDGGESRAEVERIAGLLEERIEGVLLGEIEGTPVPVPSGDEGGLSAARAAEADDDPSLPGEWIDLATIYGGAYNDDAGHVVVDVDYADDCAATETGTEVCNTDPPAGGPHWSGACAETPTDSPAFCGPAQWGIYRQPWEPETLVHNMEHAGVIVWYNTSDQDAVDDLEALVEERLTDGDLLVMAPYPEMEAETIALTSWSRIDTFAASEYNRERVDAFIDAHERRFNPESF